MDVDVTVLSDNSVNTKGLLAEHGLSILVKRDAQQVLFDAGQGVSALHNAHALGVTLRSPPVVLSHGHYDHTGGLRFFLRAFPSQTIVAHPEVFKDRFSGTPGGHRQSIGMSFTKEDLEQQGAAICLRDDPYEVLKGVWTTGQIARPFATDQAINGLSLDAAGCVIDDVRDEMAVIVEGAEKTLLLLGCAHAGVRNTVQQAEALTEKPLCGIVGGLHLTNARPREVRALALFLHERGVRFVAASHCTGYKTAVILGSYLKCKLTAVGTHLSFSL